MSVRFQNPAEMRLAQNDDVIQTLTPDRSDQPFGKAILPRRGWCSGLVPDAHGTQAARDDNAIDSIPISDHQRLPKHKRAHARPSPRTIPNGQAADFFNNIGCRRKGDIPARDCWSWIA